MRFVLSTLLISFLITGCATPYKPNGMGGGYRDMKIGENKYEVAFNGNGYSSMEHVEKHWARRASEVCPNGYDVLYETSDINEANISGETALPVGGAYIPLPVTTKIRIPWKLAHIQCHLSEGDASES